MYQGTNPKRNYKYEVFFGKCAAPMATMIKELEKLN